jgi:hypothetical protein
LPNGNPAPGPKFDYKLRWFERLSEHAGHLLASGAPVVLAGDYNVMPTDIDVYAPARWVDDALFRPEVREAYRRLVAQGWTDALRALIRMSGSTRSGNTSETHLPAMPGFASIIWFDVHEVPSPCRLVADLGRVAIAIPISVRPCRLAREVVAGEGISIRRQ